MTLAPPRPRWPYRVLVVEPGPPLVDDPEGVVNRHGLELHRLADPLAALLALPDVDPSALLVPLSVATADVGALIRAVHERSDVRVLVGLDDDSPDEALYAAVEAGADGLVSLPCSPASLLRALRLAGPARLGAAGVVVWGRVTADRARLRALVDGERDAGLTPSEFTLLAHLMAAAPQLVTYAELGARLDPARPLSEIAVRVQVGRLRSRLRAAGIPDGYLENSRGLGYRLPPPPGVSEPGPPARRPSAPG